MPVLLNKIKRSRFLSLQSAFVLIAFIAMTVASYLFTSEIVHKHMINEVTTGMEAIEAKVNTSLTDPQMVLMEVAITIQHMISTKNTVGEMEHYLEDIDRYFYDNPELITGFNGIYAYLDGSFATAWISGNGYSPSSDFIPADRLWYTSALETGGKLAVTPPYQDTESGEEIISYSIQIFDEAGRPQGVVATDIFLRDVAEYVTNLHGSEGSYGILLDQRLNVVVAFPDETEIGKPLQDVHSGIAALSDELAQGHDISERKVINYRGEEAIVFFRQLSNHWTVGMGIPIKSYNQDVTNMWVFLLTLGLGLAAILIFLLLRLNKIRVSAEEARYRAEAANLQKTHFLATMSHEIRTPMNVILGISEMELQEEGMPLKFQDGYRRIYDAGSTLLGIINDILDLSRIEVGKLELVLERYNTASLINDTLQLNMLRIREKPIQMELEIDEDFPAELYGDQLRIKQILNNLLSNGIKYTEEGRVKLSISIRSKENRPILILDVSDTGRGMSKDQIDKLFDEYTRFNQMASRNTEGTGLGMSITKSLVELMGGTIAVESKENIGSSFTVELPQEIASDQVLGKALTEKLKSFHYIDFVEKKTKLIREQMPYGKVLIVDDVATNLYVAKGLMALYDVEIELAESGFEAIDKIQAGAIYDIVFMDHMMPKMDGIETVKKMRDMGYTGTIVALTANALHGQATLFLQNGFEAFISKPIDVRQLDAILKKYIRDKKHER